MDKYSPEKPYWLKLIIVNYRTNLVHKNLSQLSDKFSPNKSPRRQLCQLAEMGRWSWETYLGGLRPVQTTNEEGVPGFAQVEHQTLNHCAQPVGLNTLEKARGLGKGRGQIGMNSLE